MSRIIVKNSKYPRSAFVYFLHQGQSSKHRPFQLTTVIDSDQKTLEGNGVNVANITVNPSNYEMFEAEVKRIGEEKQQKEDAFWAMKGIVTLPLNETNISYRNSLAQMIMLFHY